MGKDEPIQTQCELFASALEENLDKTFVLVIVRIDEESFQDIKVSLSILFMG